MPCCISRAWRNSLRSGLPRFLQQFLGEAAAILGESHRIGFPGSPGRGLTSMHMHIRHETRYRYERPVKYSVQSLHLTPRRDWSQRALSLEHHRAGPAA